jgi:tRNA pseudouridine55 synthase
MKMRKKTDQSQTMTNKPRLGGSEGVLIINKPSGLSSHDVVEQVRKTFRTRKVGHTGTLDPFATGVLVLCIGKATRAARFFEGLDKAYRAVLNLGVTTETGDRDGKIVAIRPVPEFSPEELESALEPFRGTIVQKPPAFSAVRVDGERLYAKARRGEKVSPPPRQVTIRTLRVESFSGDRIELYIECSKGTYVRSLASDLGEALGCGAHCAALVRTRVGPFSIDESIPLEHLDNLSLEDALQRVLGLDSALARFMEPVRLSPKGAWKLIRGSPVEKDEVLDMRDPNYGVSYRALDPEGQLVAIVEPVRLKRGIMWVPKRVLTCPK